MAYGLSGYNISPINYQGKDGIMFHLQDDMSTFLSLSATTDIRYQSPMQASTHPVMSGANVADNQARQPKTISITGVQVVSYEGAFLQTRSNTQVEDFVSTVELWRDQKQLVRVIAKDGLTLSNCVITDFSASKNKEIANGLNIDMTFTSIDIVKPAQKTNVHVNQQGGSNANGEARGAKTKTGAIQERKNLGSQATKTTQSADACEWARSRPDEEISANVKLARLNAQCKQAQRTFNKPGGGTGRVYDRDNGRASSAVEAYKIENHIGASGNNINNQTGKHVK